MGRFNYRKAAEVLAHAHVTTDEASAKKYGVTKRTIRNYRSRLDTDPELSSLFHELVGPVDQARSDRIIEKLIEADRATDESYVLGLEAGNVLCRAIMESPEPVLHLHLISEWVDTVGGIRLARAVFADEGPEASESDHEAAGAAGPHSTAARPGSREQGESGRSIH